MSTINELMNNLETLKLLKINALFKKKVVFCKTTPK